MNTTQLTYFLLIFTFFSIGLSAQESEIELNSGFGSTTVDEYNMKFVMPFSNDIENANFFRFGLNYYYSPTSAIFNLKTGLNYDIKWKNEIKLNYLRTPIGLDFNFGKKVQFILGGGLFLSYLISYTGTSNNTNFEQTKNRFQIGWYANTGIGFQVSEIYNLSIKYQYSADITKMYDYHRTSPGGSPYELDAKSYDGFIILCLKYKLKNK